MKRFKKLYIEITNICNLRCHFCSEITRPAEFMTLETFQKILDQITPFTDYLYFHVKGEPLLHPDIDRFLDLCHEKGLKVNLTTNGTLIHEVADKLLRKPALRQINFSLHSYDSNEQSTSKEAYLSRIFSFISESRMHNEIIISFRLWNHNQGGIRSTSADKNREVLAHIERAFQLPFIIQEKLTPSHGLKLAEKVYLSLESEFEWPSLDKKDDCSKGFCYALKTQAAILVDGTVVPCCLDGDGIINLGNIHRTPFADIIAGERAEKIRQGFQKREVVEEMCRRCTYRKRFN